MYLHDDASQFRATVLSCADALGIALAFVAKDYYIVLLLSEIAKANPDVVFKGGTSLSKCHHAIDRDLSDSPMRQPNCRTRSDDANSNERQGKLVSSLGDIRGSCGRGHGWGRGSCGRSHGWGRCRSRRG